MLFHRTIWYASRCYLQITYTHSLLVADSPLVFAQEFAITQGYSQSVITYIIAIANAGGLVGHIIFGLMADMFGPYVQSLTVSTPQLRHSTFSLNLLAAGMGVSGVLIACWLAVDSPATLIVWAALYGGTVSVFMTVRIRFIVVYSSSLCLNVFVACLALHRGFHAGHV